jgi:acetyl esterase/lipase
VHDAWEALLWTVTKGVKVLNLDPSRLAIGGSSAGGNLAAVMTQKALMLRDQMVSGLDSGIKFVKQLLIVPVTDNTASVETNPSYRSCEYTPALPPLKMLWFRNHYLPDPSTWEEVEASPLLFPAERFAELPPAVILVGELDVLRHEGEEYARKLKDAGVDARVELMKGMPHPFLAMDAVLDQGQRAITILCETLVDAFR